jgi:hypothetical protein
MKVIILVPNTNVPTNYDYRSETVLSVTENVFLTAYGDYSVENVKFCRTEDDLLVFQYVAKEAKS